MRGDRGLDAERAKLASARATEERAAEHGLALVEQALHESSERVRSAISAFLQAAEAEGIKPQRFVHRYRETGPPPKVRWRQDPKPAPKEPVYKDGYVVVAWSRLSGDMSSEHNVVVWTSGEVERDYTPNTSRVRELPSNGLVGALPFYIRGSELKDGAVHDAINTDTQLETIQKTADWFVAKLAAFLEGPDRPVAGLWRP
jgi:hypothetical protein